MSPPAANTRSRSATPSNTPVKARGNGSSPPASVDAKLSALSLLCSSPEANDEQQATQTTASLLRVNLFGLLGGNSKAHEDRSSRAEFSSMLAEYTSVGQVASSDPIFTISREHFGMKEFKLVLIGGASVGKSAYVEKLKSNCFMVNYDPTNKLEVSSLVFNTNHGPIKVDFWDVGGCNPFDGYYVGAHGAILMYDMGDKSPMKVLKGIHENFRRVCEGIPIVLVGNKADSSSTRKKDQNGVAAFRRKKTLQVRTRWYAPLGD